MPKKTPVKARKRPKVSEKEFVREKVSEATGVNFEVVAPHPGFPLPAESLEWFMRCRNKEEIGRAPYLNTAWKYRGGEIWLESLAVGDTVDWIELAYGDEKAGESLDLDYSRMDDPEFSAELERRYPVVMARIREYEAVAAEVSKRTNTRLELRRVGSRGMLVFTLAARVKSVKDQKALGSALQRSASALGEAYAQTVRV